MPASPRYSPDDVHREFPGPHRLPAAGRPDARAHREIRNSSWESLLVGHPPSAREALILFGYSILANPVHFLRTCGSRTSHRTSHRPVRPCRGLPSTQGTSIVSYDPPGRQRLEVALDHRVADGAVPQPVLDQSQVQLVLAWDDARWQVEVARWRQLRNAPTEATPKPNRL